MNNYDKMVEIIEEYGLNGEQVLRFLTDYNGTDIINDDFIDNLLRVELA